MREWAKDLLDTEIERRPEGAKLKDNLKELKQKAIDVVMESGTPDDSCNIKVDNLVSQTYWLKVE